MSVKISTNLSSLLVQANLTQSTNSLNMAIERLTTGCKINHASDNAANYSISNDMSSKLSSYTVAQDNVMAGLDLLATASDTVSLMQQHGQRIHALITQARNGTYGADSLSAVQSEIGARIAEIQRLHLNTQYNGIDLLNGFKLPEWAEEVKANAGIDAETGTELAPRYNGFIADPEAKDGSGNPINVDALPSVAGLESLSGTQYKISTVDDLVNLATLVNRGVDTSGKTFYLNADIDLTAYCSEYSAEGGWTPIGDYSTNESYAFKGIFDGNGHKVRGVNINRDDTDYQGLFGYSTGTIKNVGVEVSIKGKQYTGGLVGYAKGSVINSYAKGNVTGTVNCTGGLIGYAYNSTVNSYSTTNVTGLGNFTGGLIGFEANIITNCYATGDVSGKGNGTGGLAGYAERTISNSYATSNVIGTVQSGGLVGTGYIVENSYAKGNVSGTAQTGGLAGGIDKYINNSYAEGNVSCTGNYVGGLVGLIKDTITNSYATGDTSGATLVGGLVGYYSALNAAAKSNNNLFSAGKVSGDEKVGSLIGGIVASGGNTSYLDSITITNASALNQDIDVIGGTYSNASGIPAIEYDTTRWLENISIAESSSIITLQVGIMGDESNQITFDTGINVDLNSILSDIRSDSAYNKINEFLSHLSKKSTELGAASNRLLSAADSISVNIENLASSRSTLRDADVGAESSKLIRQQILQQASATLLATANQSPSIALQLI